MTDDRPGGSVINVVEDVDSETLLLAATCKGTNQRVILTYTLHVGPPPYASFNNLSSA